MSRAISVPLYGSGDKLPIKFYWSRGFGQKLGEPAIIAKLMFAMLSRSFNKISLSEYCQVLERGLQQLGQKLPVRACVVCILPRFYL